MANIFTLFRVVVSLPIVLLVLNGSYTLALALAIAGALSDLVDGKVARSTGEHNGFGKILDPIADKIFVLSSLIALVEVGRISSIPVVLLIFRELSISLLRNSLALQGTFMGASFLGKLKTFMEFLSVTLLIYGHWTGEVFLWVSVALAYISFYDYIKLYRRLSDLNYP